MSKNPFDDQPNEWVFAIIIVICAVFIGYMIFVMWPMLAMVWMLVAQLSACIRVSIKHAGRDQQ